MTAPSHLRAEHRRDALGIGVRRPRLSWRLPDGAGVQTAYELSVDGTAARVESDTNVPNGESLVRQFLLGKAYIRDTFGRETNILWLPDVFGYSAALPQIIKGAGLQYFMTTKISWNEYNRLPYDTFRWRGIDGTEVLTHMPTAPLDPAFGGAAAGMAAFYTYNAKFTPYDVAGTWTAYRQKDVNDELLYLFGFGDGGDARDGGAPGRAAWVPARRAELG